MEEGVLQSFLLQVGIDSKGLDSGSKAITQAVLHIHDQLDELIDSFNDVEVQVDDTGNKISSSTEKASKKMQGHAKGIGNAFNTLSKQLMAFAGVTLSIGGAVSFVDGMTTKLQSLTNQSKQLGMTAASIDGWRRAFGAAGDDPNAATSTLGNIRAGLNSVAQTGQGNDALAALAQLGVNGAYDPNSNVDDLLRQAVGRLQQMGNTAQAQNLASRLGLGAGASQAAFNGSLLSNQRFFQNRSSLNGVNDQEVAQLAKVREEFGQTVDSITTTLFKEMLPVLNEVAQGIDRFINGGGGSEGMNQLRDMFQRFMRDVFGGMQASDVANTLNSVADGFNRFLTVLNKIGNLINHLNNGNISAALNDVKELNHSQDSSQDNRGSWERAQDTFRNSPAYKILHGEFSAGASQWYRTNFGGGSDTQGNSNPEYDANGNRLNLATRNNNPGNLRPVGSSKGFQKFDTIEEGWAALQRQLMLYYNGQSKAAGNRKLRTVGDIMGIYAPENENNTAAYKAHVANQLGVGVNDQINLNDPNVMRIIMQAIAKYEGYQGDLNTGLPMTGANAYAARNTTNNNGSSYSNETHIGTVNVNSNPESVSKLTNDVHNQVRSSNVSLTSIAGQS